MEDNMQDSVQNILHGEPQEAAPEVQEVVQEQPVQDNSYNVNIANLRAAKEKAEAERAQMAQQLEEMQRQQAEPEDEQGPDYGDEDLIEGKHLRKEMDSFKKQLASYKAQQIAATDEARLKQVYTDFDKVVSAENIAKLKEVDPETAETIAMSNAPLYTRGAAAYKRIKELNLIVEDNHEGDRARAQENVAKPRPSNSVSPQQSDSPLGMANAFANGLTEDLKKQLWKEMQDSAKNF